MRSIAILNQKGGVGKTTTAVNVSAALARQGLRVLLVDLDPQSHATLHLGADPEDGEPSVYDVLCRDVPIADAARSINDHYAIVPAALDLVGAELELADREERERVLARKLQPYQTGFDYCLIDCAPSLGLLTVNALASVQEVMIPLQPHFLALQGLGRLLETVALVRRGINPDLCISGIVLCMYESATRLAQEVRDDVQRFVGEANPDDPWYGACVYESVIRRNIKLAECPSFGQSVFDYAPSSNGAVDYLALADEIHTRGQQQPARDTVTSGPASRDAHEVAAEPHAAPQPADDDVEQPAQPS